MSLQGASRPLSYFTALRAPRQFPLPPPVPGPPDGRAGLGCSSASVLGSPRSSSSECGGVVPGNAEGPFVVLVGPAQPVPITPISNTRASQVHLLDEMKDLHGRCQWSPTRSVALRLLPDRSTMRIRELQWPRDFLDRRFRTAKAMLKPRRNAPVPRAFRLRTSPRPRNAGVTPLALS